MRPTILRMTMVPVQTGADRLILKWVNEANKRVEPNLYAPQIVNTGELTRKQGAPLLILFRLPPEGTSVQEMWNAFQSDLRLWSI